MKSHVTAAKIKMSGWKRTCFCTMLNSVSPGYKFENQTCEINEYDEVIWYVTMDKKLADIYRIWESGFHSGESYQVHKQNGTL